jgi:putative transposase
MPNHFHLVLWPREDGDLSRWMQWLLTTHVRSYHEHHQTTGHVWQGRFKSFPIQEDEHLLAVLRYVERNPLRAELVKAAALWPHSSLCARSSPARPKWHSEGPVKRGQDWVRHVDQPQSAGELQALRRSVERDIPYGGERWQQRTVTALGLENTLRSRGRPRKQNNEACPEWR